MSDKTKPVDVIVRSNRKDIQIYQRDVLGDCEILLDCSSRVNTKHTIQVSTKAVGLVVSGDGRVDIDLIGLGKVGE